MRPSVTAGTSPFMIWRSEPQIVVMLSFTMMSVGSLILGFGTSSRARLPGPWYTSAFIRIHSLPCGRAFAGGTEGRRTTDQGPRAAMPEFSSCTYSAREANRLNTQVLYVSRVPLPSGSVEQDFAPSPG